MLYFFAFFMHSGTWFAVGWWPFWSVVRPFSDRVACTLKIMCTIDWKRVFMRVSIDRSSRYQSLGSFFVVCTVMQVKYAHSWDNYLIGWCQHSSIYRNFYLFILLFIFSRPREWLPFLARMDTAQQIDLLRLFVSLYFAHICQWSRSYRWQLNNNKYSE